MKHSWMMILVTLLLVACGAQAPATVPPAPTSASGQTGIDGRLIGISDVATVPDVVLEGAGVVAFQQAELAPLVQGGEDNPALYTPTIERPGLLSASAITTQAGAYAFDLPPGDYYVCLAGFQMEQVQPPFTLSGCVAATVAPGERLTLDLGWGLGGLYAY